MPTSGGSARRPPVPLTRRSGLIDATYSRVVAILTAKKALLVQAAEELKRVETLEGDRLRQLLA